jgi:hypothetical protein
LMWIGRFTTGHHQSSMSGSDGRRTGCARAPPGHGEEPAKAGSSEQHPDPTTKGSWAESYLVCRPVTGVTLDRARLDGGRRPLDRWSSCDRATRSGWPTASSTTTWPAADVSTSPRAVGSWATVPGRRRSQSPGHEPRMPHRRPDRSGGRGFGAAPRVPRPGIRAGYRGSRSGTVNRDERYSREE